MEARDWSLRNETKSMVWAKRFVGNDGSDKEKSKTEKKRFVCYE